MGDIMCVAQSRAKGKEEDMYEAKPTKLRDGSWGARVDGSPRPGDRIIITSKGGKSWVASVGRVLWSGDGISIVTTISGRGGSRIRTGCPCGSIEDEPRDSDCESCRFDNQ
jgi:hypothetical protein